MGFGIGHHGGPVPEATVDEIIGYLEAEFKKAGLTETDDWQNAWPKPLYWRIDVQTSEVEKQVHNKIRETQELFPPEREIEDAKVRWESSSGRERAFIEEEIKRLLFEQARPKLKVPGDFQYGREKGLGANLDPHAEDFTVVFTQNGSKDEWRDLGGFTKTSFIDPWPGAAVTMCRLLKEVQGKVKSAGGDFEIEDGAEICDDFQTYVVRPRRRSSMR